LLHGAAVLSARPRRRACVPLGDRPLAPGDRLSRRGGRPVVVLLPVHLGAAVPRRASRDVLHPADVDVRVHLLSHVRLQSDDRVILLVRRAVRPSGVRPRRGRVGRGAHRVEHLAAPEPPRRYRAIGYAPLAKTRAAIVPSTTTTTSSARMRFTKLRRTSERPKVRRTAYRTTVM